MQTIQQSRETMASYIMDLLSTLTNCLACFPRSPNLKINSKTYKMLRLLGEVSNPLLSPPLLSTSQMLIPSLIHRAASPTSTSSKRPPPLNSTPSRRFAVPLAKNLLPLRCGNAKPILYLHRMRISLRVWTIKLSMHAINQIRVRRRCT